MVFGGGIIPDDDVAALHDAGVAGVFGPGTATTEIIRWCQEHVQFDDGGGE